MKMKKTIEKLKEVGLFDDFKKAMEILVEETDKPKHKWDNNKLNLNGLKYNHESYDYDWWSKEYFETFKVYYSDDDFKMSGLDFGCIKWNLHLKIKGMGHFYTYESYIKGDYEYDPFSHQEYINKVTDISFSCFRSKTPLDILNVIEGKYDLELN